MFIAPSEAVVSSSNNEPEHDRQKSDLKNINDTQIDIRIYSYTNKCLSIMFKLGKVHIYRTGVKSDLMTKFNFYNMYVHQKIFLADLIVT